MHEKGIETFLAVAMSRTLGKAADLLNVTQSTISYNLSELESDMGMLLVDRQKGMKSVHLTPAGESFLPLALKWQEVSREISNAKNLGSEHVLSVGGTANVNCCLMSDVYRDLLAHNPPVCLKIYTDLSDRMSRAVENRDLDVAIVLHEENSRYIQAEPFFSEPMVAARVPFENEDVESCISSSNLHPEQEFYIEWSGAYRLWHDHLWKQSKTSNIRIDSVNLAASLISKPGQWCIIPQSEKGVFEKSAVSVVFHSITEHPPDLIYYKLTHRSPKVTSLPGLAIFNEVSSKRGFN